MNTIYIICQSNLYTGGTILLHQLCHKLCLYGYNAKMYYFTSDKDPIPVFSPHLAKYQVPVVDEVIDSPHNICIIAEGYSLLLQDFKKTSMRLMLWWMSVDNYSRDTNGQFYPPQESLRNFPRLFHLVQSEYAKRHVEDTLGISHKKVFYLSDYLDSSYTSDSSITYTASSRLPIILYNPKKGFETTKRFINTANTMPEFQDIRWIPLIDYSPDEMAVLMRKSRLYIDFGHHPGMDRIPREAAINGCCVITGRKGAAQNDIDIPIPPEYKPDEQTTSIADILKQILYTINNYDTCIDDFITYRDLITCQEQQFDTNLLQIFSKFADTNTITEN